MTNDNCPLFYPMSPSILLKTRSVRRREGPGRRYFATDPRKKQVPCTVPLRVMEGCGMVK